MRIRGKSPTRGVDTVAHTTAIKEGGRTKAVLGDVLHPPESEEPQTKIMKEHLAINQYPDGTG